MKTILGGKQILIPDQPIRDFNGHSPKAILNGKNFHNATWNGNVGFPPPEAGCVLYLPGNPIQGSTIYDFSSSFYDSTINTDEPLDATETGIDCDADATTAIPVGSVIRIGGEKMLVMVTGTTLTVVRGYANTTATTHLTAQDIYSQTANNGAISGATWKRLGSGLWYLDFDGDNDVVDCGSGDSITTGLATQITLEGWVYPETLGEGNLGHIISSDDGTYWRVFLVGATRIRFELQDDSPLTHTIDSNASSIPLNTWTRFACTYDGANQYIYINGAVQTDTTAYVDGLLTNAAATVRLGNIADGSRTWDGGIALPRIHNVGRTAAQVMSDYQRERHLFGV